ncbi:hypothetical protein DMENIID0001_037980 [Sergentomyia squamirostris]
MCPGTVESAKRRLFDVDDSESIASERSESEDVLSSLSVSVINVVDLFAPVSPPDFFAMRTPPNPNLLRRPIPIRERPLDVRTLEQRHKWFMTHVMDVFDWLGEIGPLSSLWEEQPEEQEYSSVPWYHQKFNERGEPHFIDQGWRNVQNNRGI